MIKSYVLSIIVAAIICAAAGILLPPKTAVGQIVKLLSGTLLIVTVVSPLTNISFRNITDYLNGLSSAADVFVEDGRAAAQAEIGAIIKTETEAYILDKARQMGLQIVVEVALDENNHSIPCGVTISGTLSPYSKENLSNYIADTLGIAKEKQIWISKG